MRKKILSVFILFFSILSSISAQTIEEKIKTLDSLYSIAITQWDVPGMAVAIVTSDDVLLSKGYGITDITTRQAVDENTLFALASNTKAFTATALSILVDRKQLSWNDKVIKYLPWFELYDPYVTNEMTIEDLLCHRSGLETFSGDLLWYGSNLTREEIIRKARFLKPKYGFRTTFGYSNILFITAGEIIPKITGKSWDNFVQEEILDKLEMNRSVLSVSKLNNMSNIAQPHTYIDGKLLKISWLSWDNMAPAGALISSANDMAKWLQLNLNDGSFNGKSIVSKESMWELQSPRTINKVYQRSSIQFPSTHFKSYALGWSLMDYLGKKIVMHNGGYDGMISQTLFIPESNIGFVIMTNSLSSVYYPLMYQTLDILLDNDVKVNWNEKVLESIKIGEKYNKENLAQIEESRHKGTKPSLSMSEYTGYYGSQLYDSVQVIETKDGLKINYLRSPIFIGDMKHWHHDTFKVKFEATPSLPEGFVTFSLNRNGKVEGMEVFVDNPDFDFTEFEFKKLN